MWAVGDWLLEGEVHILKGKKRSKVRELAAELTGYSTHTLTMAASVARKVDPSMRIDGLSWWHHLAVAQLASEEQARWLVRAAEDDWSVARLREELRDSSPMTARPSMTRRADWLVSQLVRLTRDEIPDGVLTELHRWWQHEIDPPNLVRAGRG
jgi:hypothetical protein